MKHLYTAVATARGGREGEVVSDDGVLDLTLTAPTETSGPGTGTNPEQLFAAGYAACFQGALGLVGKKHGVDTANSLVEAAVGFGPEGDSFAITVDQRGVALEVSAPDGAHDLVAALLGQPA